MIVYFRENNGDYLAIETDTNSYYVRNFAKDYFEGRATAIENLVGSVCTTSISREFLTACCKRIAKAKVPAEWCEAIGY